MYQVVVTMIPNYNIVALKSMESLGIDLLSTGQDRVFLIAPNHRSIVSNRTSFHTKEDAESYRDTVRTFVDVESAYVKPESISP